MGRRRFGCREHPKAPALDQFHCVAVVPWKDGTPRSKIIDRTGSNEFVFVAAADVCVAAVAITGPWLLRLRSLGLFLFWPCPCVCDAWV